MKKQLGRNLSNKSAVADHSENANLPSFSRHLKYEEAIGQIHSRPVSKFPSNTVVLHYAFMSDGGSLVPHTLLTNICRQRGESLPDKDASFHEVPWGKGKLRWEKHNEFSTFTFNCPADDKFLGQIKDHPFGVGFNAPGSLISACRIEIRKFNSANLKLLNNFDQNSLSATKIGSRGSLMATDFRQNTDGMTVFLLLEDKMPDNRIGFYVRSALELETYRTLAMLGLPLAQKLSSKISAFELELSKLTRAIKNADTDENEKLLSEINNLAAELDADAVSSLFRFGATKAYGNIASTRAQTIGEENLSGYVSISDYLTRSLKPAMSTCTSVEERQENMSQKLARAANLLRTRVEIAIENQNRNLLASMDKRNQLQFRLQQTVEGLSVAAVSYYIVGLIFYLASALNDANLLMASPKIIAGFSVPIVIVAVWMLVQRLKKSHFKSSL